MEPSLFIVLRAGAMALALMLLSPPLSAQAAPEQVKQRLAELWDRSFAPGADVTDREAFPREVALALGLRFQAKADRLTPTLDSALSRAVMSGGGFRDEPWAWFALARQLQATNGSCLPYSTIRARTYFGWCRRTINAYREAFERDSLFAPVLADLNSAIPWPALWLEPDVESRLLSRAVADSGIPRWLRLKLERRRLLTRLNLDTLVTMANFKASGSDTVLANGEFAFIRSRLAAKANDTEQARTAYALASSDSGAGEHLRWIREDVEYTGTVEELTAWDSLPATGRAIWMTEYWESRDLEDGLAPGGRYRAHVTRWSRAFSDIVS